MDLNTNLKLTVVGSFAGGLSFGALMARLIFGFTNSTDGVRLEASAGAFLLFTLLGALIILGSFAAFQGALKLFSSLGLFGLPQAGGRVTLWLLGGLSGLLAAFAAVSFILPYTGIASLLPAVVAGVINLSFWLLAARLVANGAESESGGAAFSEVLLMGSASTVVFILMTIILLLAEGH